MNDAHEHTRDHTREHTREHTHERRPGDGDARPRSTFTEEFKISGEKVLETLRRLVREGNVRRIILKHDDGRTLIEIPLTLGVIGTALLPVWAAVGAIAALVANLTIAVEKVGDDDAEPQGAPAPPPGPPDRPRD